MRMQEHMAYGGAASAAAWYFWGPWNALIFWLATVLIDFDHYIDHVYRTRGGDWRVSSLFRLDEYFREKLKNGGLNGKVVCFSLFHTVEFFALLYYVGLYTGHQAVFVVFAGMLFHLFLDLLSLAQSKCLFIRALSIVEYFIRRNLLRQKGMNPDEVFHEAYRRFNINYTPAELRSDTENLPDA